MCFSARTALDSIVKCTAFVWYRIHTNFQIFPLDIFLVAYQRKMRSQLKIDLCQRTLTMRLFLHWFAEAR